MIYDEDEVKEEDEPSEDMPRGGEGVTEEEFGLENDDDPDNRYH